MTLDTFSAGRKYRIVYADPPWKYSNTGVNGAACKHYPVMKTPEIAALGVGNMVEDDSALFLWATWPNLPQAVAVMDAWGFRYVTAAFVWAKMVKDWDKREKWAGGEDLSAATAFGPGFYTRANTEVCLLGIRGKLRPSQRNVRQVVFSEREAHSAKPREVRDRIDRLFPEGRRIELFARTRVPGWDAWGMGVDDEQLDDNMQGKGIGA